MLAFPSFSRRRLAALVAAAAVVVCPAAAAAADKPERPPRVAAEEALESVQDAFDGRGVPSGRELTHELIELARGLPRLDRADRRTARRLLARPSDGAADPAGGGWTAPPEDWDFYCTANFCLHWVVSTADAPDLIDSNANGVPDYVEDMAFDFEFQHQVQNGTGAGQLGWVEPKSDGTLGGDARTDVYISELSDDGIYGYASTDPGQSGNSRSAYLVMDDDYEGFPTPPEGARRVTAAHEYNHILQFAYDVFQDLWMFESTAVWAEEKVYDSVNDYLLYLPEWAVCSELPLTSAPRSGEDCSLKIYGSGIWNLWLDSRYGADVVRRAWERSLSTSPPSFAPGAYDAALGGPSFAAEFGAFSAALPEWRVTGSGIREGDSFGGDVERVGTLADGGSSIRTLDHTTFALLNVPVPAGNPPQLRLNVALPTGTPGAVALVGRTGASPAAGTLTTELQQMPSGGGGSVTLANPGSFGRITAVLVNSSTSQAGWNPSAQDWAWTGDDVPMGAALSSTGDPAPPGVEPPDTSITRAPGFDLLAPAAATYEFSASTAGATFECSLNGSAYGPCSSPHTYTNLGSRRHSFAVRARNSYGADPSPAQHSFDVRAPDLTRPAIARLGLAPKRFRAARRGASVARRRAPVGTRVAYALSESASVSFAVDRLKPGRRAKRRCVKRTRRNRRAPACTRVLPLPQGFTQEGDAGFNDIRFRGRLGGRALRPGRYRLTLVAQDAAGNRSLPARARFRIVKR